MPYGKINLAHFQKTQSLLNFFSYARNEVFNLDFQAISHADFASGQSFAAAFSGSLLVYAGQMPKKAAEALFAAYHQWHWKLLCRSTACQTRAPERGCGNSYFPLREYPSSLGQALRFLAELLL